MAKQLLEMWSVYDAPGSQNILGMVRVWVDPEGNAGLGEITYADTTPGGTDTSIGRTLYQDDEYPEPPNPFYSSQGKKLTCSQAVSQPYASVAAENVVCNLTNLNIEVSPATQGNNGQISISVSGSNGRKEYSIDNGASWSSSPVFSGLAPGSYIVVAADAQRYCTITDTVTVENEIEQVDDLKITAVTVTNQQAPPGDEDSGSIYVSATSTNKPLTFKIVHPSGAAFTQEGISTTTFINLFPGVYTVVVTDSNGNTRTQPNIVVLAHNSDEPSEPLEPTDVTADLDFEIIDVACENPYPITWLNHLGGWDMWVFENHQEFGIEAEAEGEYDVAYSSLADIEGNREYTSRSGRKTVKVGANNLTQDQAEAIAKIMQSRAVYLIEKDEDTGEWFNKVKLTPQPGSLKAYETSLVYNTVELTFIYPEEYL